MPNRDPNQLALWRSVWDADSSSGPEPQVLRGERLRCKGCGELKPSRELTESIWGMCRVCENGRLGT